MESTKLNSFIATPSSSPPPTTDELPTHFQDFPKKIWQSWKDDSESPTDRTVGFPHQWRTVNPEYRYERLTDHNIDAYIQSRFPDISDLFSQVTDGILRADFLRYLVMAGEGGVWADIDVFPHQPISTWIPPRYSNGTNLVVGIENDHHKHPIWPNLPYSVQLAQYTILAKPGHPALLKLIDQVCSNLAGLLLTKAPGEDITFEDVMATTGPFAFTKALMEYFTEITGTKYTGDQLDTLQEPILIGDVLVLPKDSFGWLPHEKTHEKGEPSILVEHLFIGSWRDGHPG